MVTNVEAQFISLLMSIYAGIVIGVLFDFYRVIIYYIKPLKILLQFMDLLFWLITSGMVFSILLRADFAELRIYTFMGISIGVFIYFKLFSSLINKLLKFIIYAFLKSIRLLFIFLIMPFKIIYNYLWNTINFIGKLVYNVTKILYKRINFYIYKNK